jgi:hypothetical protein
LRQCYCSNGALSQYAVVSRDILRARYSKPLGADLEVTVSPARGKRGVSPEIAAAASASLSTRPIVLLGYVGVGKTMFIRHLVRVEAKDVFEHAIVLYANLGAEPALGDLDDYIIMHFTRQLRDEYHVSISDREFVREVYSADLKEFAAGPWGELLETNSQLYREKEITYLASLVENREEHLRRSLEFLTATRNRQIVTILDNVDQRDHEPAFQDRIFLLAETLAKTWPGTVFVALRPDTFSRSKRSGTLSAYQPRVFAVSPPRVDQVIEKRLSFARRQIPSASGQSDRAWNTDAIDDYLEILIRSFRRRDELKELMDNLSGGNIRRALELLTTFISSPHVGAERALATFRRNGGYYIPYHVFLRAVMLGEKRHYDPSSSPVANLLDIGSDDRREHFLLPIIIALLRRTGEPGVQEGFVGVERIYAFCQDLGFTPEQISWQLDRAVAADLVDVSPLEGSPELYRATTIGSYTEQALLGSYTYINEIVVDTPIVDDIIRGSMDDVRSTEKRLQRAENFCEYLDGAWAQLADRETGFDWNGRSAAIRKQISDVEVRLTSPRHTSPSKPDFDF